ncbi:DUF6538 domain-containing protein [Puniceibacterium sediminis]
MTLGSTPRFHTTMVLHISRPHKYPKTGVYCFRQKTPADLRKVYGKSEISWSLKTKNEDEAKLRHVEALRKQALVWRTLRTASGSIPHKNLVAIAGGFYRSLVAMIEDEPGESSIWTTMIDKFSDEEPSADALEKWFGPDADRLLREEGVSADAYSRARLCEELHKVWLQWSGFQLRRSEGDYSPDPKADRFPPKETLHMPAEASSVTETTISVSGLFNLWERDHLANGKPQKTVDDFRQKIGDLTAFLGHDDAQQVSARSFQRWPL